MKLIWVVLKFHLFQYCKMLKFSIRYALSFLDVGTIANGNESFVSGCSFNDGFNAGIGVYGTNDLTVKNNVIHHTVGPGIDLEGAGNKLLNNLVTYSISEATYKVTFKTWLLLQ